MNLAEGLYNVYKFTLEETRYDLDCILVIPYQGGKVRLRATNGKGVIEGIYDTPVEFHESVYVRPLEKPKKGKNLPCKFDHISGDEVQRDVEAFKAKEATDFRIKRLTKNQLIHHPEGNNIRFHLLLLQ